MTHNLTRQTVSSGTTWETLAGYARAVRIGERILVSGTTATDENGRLVGRDDPAAQTHYILDKIGRALEQLDSSLEDIVRTRIYLNDVNDWEPVARAHGERFGHILPANTLVEAKLVGEGYLVEIEAEAMIGVGGAKEGN